MEKTDLRGLGLERGTPGGWAGAEAQVGGETLLLHHLRGCLSSQSGTFLPSTLLPGPGHLGGC